MGASPEVDWKSMGIGLEQVDPGEDGGPPMDASPMVIIWEGMGLQRGGGACEGGGSNDVDGWANSGGESEVGMWVGKMGTQTEARTPCPSSPKLRGAEHSHKAPLTSHRGSWS